MLVLAGGAAHAGASTLYDSGFSSLGSESLGTHPIPPITEDPEDPDVEDPTKPELDRNAPAETRGLFVNTETSYYRDLTSTADAMPDLAAQIEALQEVAVPMWLAGDWELNDGRMTSALERSEQAGEIPMFVLYNIPDRDLGNWSAGGASSDDAYLAWVQRVSDLIGDHDAVVVLEPDAIGHIPNVSEGAATSRLELLAEAVDILDANSNTAVYLDAGHATWLESDTAADLIKRVDEYSESGIDGISLNVSNFVSEEQTREYAEDLEDRFGRDLYVLIDNSRNGANVPSGEWCNPSDQRLGESETEFDPMASVVTVFVKVPGQSDGQCGISDAIAGQFDRNLLLEQLGQL